MSRRALSLAVAGLAICALAAGTGAAGQLVLPPEWTAEKTEEGAQLHYSPDLRCRVALVDAGAERVTGEQMWAALREVAPAHGLSLQASGEPVSFERGEFVGSIRLRQLAADDSTWQLQACFYRERNRHVCKPICQKLLD